MSAGSAMRRATVLAPLLLWLALLASGPAWGGPELRKGVNLSHWLQYDGRQTVTAADLEVVRQAGFDHVRLPVDPAMLGWRPGRAEAPLETRALTEALGLIIAAGLDVIVDLHLDEAAKAAIEADSRLEAGLDLLWRRLAAVAVSQQAGRVALEVLNEPQYYGAFGQRRWERLQTRLLAAVRSRAPHTLVLLGGRMGGDPDGLTELRPPADADVAYVFHFYHPHLFTHQGAEWMEGDPYTAVASVRGVPYPASAGPLPKGNSRKAELDLRRYRAEGWDAARIRADLAPVAAWARANSVRVVCTEFGVLRTHALPDARYRWLADTREALESLGFGWTVWDLADVFGIAEASGPATPPPPRRIETAARQALGLTAPRP